jgi:hypothetical protein
MYPVLYFSLTKIVFRFIIILGLGQIILINCIFEKEWHHWATVTG